LSSRPKIDEIDVRILKAMFKDSRTSFAKIAKDCKMSTNAIRRRFINLKRSGVITGATIQVQLDRLGYKGIAFLAIEADVYKEQSVLKFLEMLPQLILSHRQIGKHNIVSISIIKEIEDLTCILETLSSNPHIRTVDTAISMNLSNMYLLDNLVIEPFNGALSNKETLPDGDEHRFFDGLTLTDHASKKLDYIIESIEKKQVTPKLELDKIDLEIIRLLSQNSRVSFRKLAKKLGVTTKTVIQRYKNLRNDVISCTTITLNLRKLGYLCNAIFCIKVVSQHKISKMVESITQLPNVISVIRCVGGIDVLAIALLANFAQLFEIKQEIAKISDIKSLEILLEKAYSTWP
jgi:DNA-binding Lrp family transcriptional regulator